MSRRPCISFSLALALSGICTFASAASAQVVIIRGDSLKVSKVVASARTELVLAPSRSIRSRQDALADSLVAIALAPSSARIGQEAMKAAVSTLSFAGSNGVRYAYAGAAARLLVIAQSAEDEQLQSVATFGLGQLRDTAAAIDALRKLAISTNAQSRWAVRYLGTNFGEPGIHVLRELRRDDTVRDRTARVFLDQFAVTYGWP